ncbi:oviduct-specific glycoprotein-like [Momordica charantia]|uniref:Oviduct-specific glycoprotein-like n=1 Tax=Momordica charantia TaxID=3673 RepID=A0A6J1CMZ0_MOMCH|nr:oviduct-specific glycoprotein-like [Momordica charantia]
MSNPDVKTLLSIPGDRDVFTKMASEPTYHEAFIQSSIEVAAKGKFNDLDLQWLYPSSQEEMQNFEILLGAWRQAAVDDAKTYHRPQWILVASVSNLPYVESSIVYLVQGIKQNLDWVNLISYDFYTPTSFSSTTGPSSALHNRIARSLSANFGIDAWIQSLANLPRKQIVFEIPFHGWAWKLANPDKNDVFSKALGPAKGYQYISQDGQIDYSNVRKFIKENHAEYVKDDSRYSISYAYAGSTWIAYESEYIIPDKISSAKSSKVLGYFAWNIAADNEVNTLASAAQTNWS